MASMRPSLWSRGSSRDVERGWYPGATPRDRSGCWRKTPPSDDGQRVGRLTTEDGHLSTDNAQFWGHASAQFGVTRGFRYRPATNSFAIPRIGIHTHAGRLFSSYDNS